MSLTAACLLGSASPVAAQTWRGLRVVPESRCSPYRASDYSYPQSIEGRIVESLGGIWSPYTGRTFASRRETDIEHIVARSEAHDSGLCAATAETRRRFATDLLNLTLASPGVNRGQKNARDVAEWLPDRNQCWFADRVVGVRQKYSLTIDRREADALDRVLASCASTALVRGGARVTARVDPGGRQRCMLCPQGGQLHGRSVLLADQQYKQLFPYSTLGTPTSELRLTSQPVGSVRRAYPLRRLVAPSSLSHHAEDHVAMHVALRASELEAGEAIVADLQRHLR